MTLYNSQFNASYGFPGKTGTCDYRYFLTTTKNINQSIQDIYSSLYKANFKTPVGDVIYYSNDNPIPIQKGYTGYLAQKSARINVSAKILSSNKIMLDFNWYSTYQSFINNPSSNLGPGPQS
ncbi:MAG TPA: hypothetical protein VIH90_03655 [Candidatus Saccharimonadales bacterium]